MGKTVKIEDIKTNYTEPHKALRYALILLERKDINAAKHAIRDALHLMGYKDSDIYPLE